MTSDTGGLGQGFDGDLEEFGAELFTYYYDRPVAFAEDVLGLELTDYQREIVDAYVENRRVAVRAGHGVGKTTAAAVVILHHTFCRPDSKTVTTAPTSRQVKEVLWSEVHKWAKDSFISGIGEWLTKRIKLGEDWFATGQTSSKPANMEGFHAPHLLYVVDEAKGVDRSIFEAIEGALTTDSRLFVISTPGEPQGYFYDIFTSDELRKDFECFHVDAEEVVEKYPEVANPEEVERKRRMWGEDSGVFEARVKGEFPEDLGNVLVPLSDLEAAERLGEDVGEEWLEERGFGLVERRLGVDVATRGRDLAVLCFVDVFENDDGGELWVCRGCEDVGVTDSMRLAGRVKRRCLERDVDVVCVDYSGNGEGVVDRLKEFDGLETEVRGVVGGESPKGVDGNGVEWRKRVLNVKAKGYWRLRNRFRRGELALVEPDERLCGELRGLGFEESGSRGRIRVVDPGGGSPDFADALCYAVTGERRREAFVLEGGGDLFGGRRSERLEGMGGGDGGGLTDGLGR